MPRVVEGGVYTIQRQQYLTSRGVQTNIPTPARGHMVIVIGPLNGYPGYWRILTITSKPYDLYEDGDYCQYYLPFLPSRKWPYCFQLKLVGGAAFEKDSYLRIDKEYWIGRDGLLPVQDEAGQWRILKGQNDRVRYIIGRREQARKEERLAGEIKELEELVRELGIVL